MLILFHTIIIAIFIHESSFIFPLMFIYSPHKRKRKLKKKKENKLDEGLNR